MKTYSIKISASKEIPDNTYSGYGYSSRNDTKTVGIVASGIHEAIVKYLYKNEYEVSALSVKRVVEKKGKER